MHFCTKNANIKKIAMWATTNFSCTSWWNKQQLSLISFQFAGCGCNGYVVKTRLKNIITTVLLCHILTGSGLQCVHTSQISGHESGLGLVQGHDTYNQDLWPWISHVTTVAQPKLPKLQKLPHLGLASKCSDFFFLLSTIIHMVHWNVSNYMW